MHQCHKNQPYVGYCNSNPSECGSVQNKEMTLYPHQEKALQLSRESFLRGNKHICLCASVSSGKTLVAKKMIEGAISKNLKVGFFSFRVILIENLKKYFDNIPNIHVCTLQKAGKMDLEELDLAIFDEKDFHGAKLKNNIKCKRSITLSGTPTDAQGYVLDFDEIINVIQIPDLVKLGLCKPIKVLSMSNADTSTLKKQGGDFNVKQSFELMQKSKVKKNIIDTYKKYCIGRKTLIFCVDTQHCEKLKNEFLQIGIKCDSVHSKKDSTQALKDFEEGKIDLLLNVAVLTTGYDFSEINTILFARPMASLPLFIQCVGRAIRKNHDKPNDEALILDCAEVVKRVGHHPMQPIDLTRKKSDKGAVKCPQCSKKMKLTDRKTQVIDRYEYVVISSYKCDCGVTKDIENRKVVNISICEGCEEEFKAVQGLQLTQKAKSLNFELECKCGYRRKFRELILSDEELKEITLEQAYKNGTTWEDVKAIITNEVKKDGFKWKYRDRLLDSCRKRNLQPKEVVEKIKFLRNQGKKMSALMYI